MSKKVHDEFVATAGDVSPKLADAITRIGPIRFARREQGDLGEVLCRGVAGQQLSVKAASTIWGRVAASRGDRALLEHLASVKPEVLRECGLSGSKAKAMRAIAETALAGGLDVDTLRRLEHPERADALTAIWGVGPWTADMISMFYFGDKDVWPDGDIAARKTLERLTSKRRKTVRTAERFAPYRSYLAMYMWRWADAKPEV